MVFFSKFVVVVATTAFMPTVSAKKRLQQVLANRDLKRSLDQYPLRLGVGSPFGRFHRDLNADQCAEDTEALFLANPALQDADDKVLDEILALEEELCTDDVNVCTIDEGSVTSVPLLHEACSNAKGALWEFDLEIDCVVRTIATGETQDKSFHYLNSPECLAPDTCRFVYVAVEYETFGEEEADLIASTLALSGITSAICESNVAPSINWLDSNYQQCWTDSYAMNRAYPALKEAEDKFMEELYFCTKNCTIDESSLQSAPLYLENETTS